MAGEEGFHVARGYVTVEPDTTDFDDELREKLEASKYTLRIKVEPDLEGFRDKVQAETEDEAPVKVQVDPDADGFREKVGAELGKQEPVEVPVEPEAEDFEAKLQAAVDASHATAEVGAGLKDDAGEKIEADLRSQLLIEDADPPKIEVGAKLRPGSLEQVLAEARSEMGFSNLGDSITITSAGGGNFATSFGNDLEDAIDEGADRGFTDVESKASSAGSKSGGLFSHGWIANLALIGVAGAPIIGGMIGGALVTALAAAVIDKSPVLKASLTASLKGAESALEKDALPAATTLTYALKDAIGQFDTLGPEIRGVFQAATPDMTAFLSGLDQGVKEFLPGFTAGLQDMQPAMVAAESDMGELGKVAGDLFKGIEDNGTGQAMAQMLGSVLQGVDNLIPGVSRLAGGITGDLRPAISALAPTLGSALSGIGSVAGAVARANPILVDSGIAFLALRTPIMSTAGALGAMGTAAKMAAANTADFAVEGDVIAGLAGGWGWLSRATAEVVGLGSAMVATAGEEGIMAAASKGLEGAMLALDAVNPVVWVAAAAAAIGTTFYAASRLATDSVNQQADALERQYHAVGYNIQGYQKLAQGLQNLNRQTQETNSLTKDIPGANTNPITSIWDHFADAAAQKKAAQATEELDHFKSGLDQVKSATGLTTSQVIKLSEELGIQGKSWTKSAAGAHANAEQVIAFANAMKTGAAGTAAMAANTKVMSFAAAQQKSYVVALAGAWSTYIGQLTGTQGSFDTYALGLSTLNANLKATGGSAGSVSHSLGDLKDKFSLTHASMDGLSQSDLELNQAFQSQVMSLQAYSTSLRESGVNAKVFDSGMKGGIDTLVKFAAGSKTATAELVAMAAQAGYRGPASLQALTQWLGNTSDGTKKMQDAMDQATLAEAKISQASKDLGSALESDVSNMMATAALRTSGAQQQMNAYAKALENAKTPASTLHSLAQALTTALEKGGLTASQAKQEVQAMGIQFGIASTKASGLAGNVGNAASQMQAAALKAYNLQTAIDDLHSKTIDVNVIVGSSVHIPDVGLGVNKGAGGGVIPGYAPGRDVVPLLASPGEGVLVPEAVRALSPAFIHGMNRKYGQGRRSSPGLMAGGGVVTESQQASYGFPQDVFNITVGPIGYDPRTTIGGTSFTGFSQLAEELKGFKTAGAQYPGQGASSYANYLATIKKDNASRFAQMEADGKKLVAAFSEGTLTTVSAIKAEAADAERTLKTYYSGPAATRLENAITRQTASMEKLAAASAKVSTTIANMKAFSAQEVQSLQGFSNISNITGTTNSTTGVTAAPTGAQIRSGLQKMLAQLRQFEAVIKKLKNRKVATVMIEQVIQLGPEQGIEYGNAILAGGASLIAQINKTEKAITGEETVIGHTSAEIQYGQSITKGFLSSLDKQEAKLKKKMQTLGDEIAKELAKALGVPLATLKKDEGIGKAKLSPPPKIKNPVTPPHIIYKPPTVHPDAKTTNVKQDIHITVNSPKGYFSPEQLAAIKHEISAVLAISH